MKNILIAFWAFIALSIVSCSKSTGSIEEPIVDTSEKLYNLKFITNDFTQTLSPVHANGEKKGTIARSAHADTVNYLLRMLVFKNGEVVTTKDSYNHLNTNHNDNSNKGVLNVSLPSGKYQIAFVATNGGFLNQPEKMDVRDLRRFYPIQFSYSSGWVSNIWEQPNSAVLYTTSFKEYNVTSDTIYSNVTLRGKTSKIVLKSTSDIPSNISNVTITRKGNWTIYPFYDINLYGYDHDNGSEVFNHFYASDIVRNSNSEYSFNLIDNSSATITLTVRFYNSDRVLLGTKVISNVEIRENHITELEGDLYSDLANNSNNMKAGDFNATVDRSYSEEKIKMKF